MKWAARVFWVVVIGVGAWGLYQVVTAILEVHSVLQRMY